MKKKKVGHFGSGFMILALDMAVSIMSSILALLMLRLIHDPFIGFQRFTLIWIGLNALCTLAAFLMFGTYKIVIRYSTFRTAGRLAASLLVSDILMFAIIAIGAIKSGTIRVELFALLLDSLITMVALVITRAIIMKILDSMFENVDAKINRTDVLIYGTDTKAISLLTRLKDSTHYSVDGFIVTDKGCDGQVFFSKRAHYVNSQEDLAKLQSTMGIKSVIFTSEQDALKEKDGIVNYCLNLGINIMNAPKLDSVEFVKGIIGDNQQGTSQSEEYIRDGMTSFEKNVKRGLDMIISAICLILFSPAFLIIAIAIKKEDGGPVIYKQERIGRFGRPFYIYKFRSMRTDAESMGPALYSGEEDPRLTKVGRFIRAHHLDELPQLYNVLCGEMAFIGPRPERKYFIDKIMEVDKRYYFLFQIRPGVTSYATLYNGYTDTLEKMIKRLDYDIYYLRNRSWWFDAKILGMTFMSIVFGKKF